MKKIKKYFQIWWLMSRNSFMGALNHRLGATALIAGKVIRFIFFFLFLLGLTSGAKVISGYTQNQIIFFYLTFIFVDAIAQFFFREVYRFRPLIISGNMDLVLVKPMSALFRSLLGGADVLDLITLPPMIIALIVVGSQLNPTPIGIIMYILLVLNGLIIAAAFHIFALTLAITTTEIDHSIMIYRDLMSLGRFPVDIYKEPLRGIVTYAIPVGVMMTFPAKALMGLISWWGTLISFILGFGLIILSLKAWGKSLTKYSSASS